MPITADQARVELAKRELSKRQSSKEAIVNRPEYQGGAENPANLQAQEDVKKAQTATDMLDIPIAPMAAANQFAGNIPRMLSGGQFPEATTPAGRAVSDVGGVAGMLASPVYPAILKPLGALAGKISQPIGKYFSESSAVKQGLKPLTEQFTQPYGLPKSELTRKIEETGKEAVGKLRDEKKLLDKSIFQESDKAATDIQSKLPEYFKRNSTIYGKELDRISDGLVKQGNPITRGEMSDILDDVMRESQDDLLASGKPMQEIDFLAKKYDINPKQVGVGEDGVPIMERPDPNQPLDFKQVVSDVKAIRNSLSSKAKIGQNYTPEDVVAAKFAKRWGDYLETKVPEFKNLNKEYAPVIATMKTAGKYFKPYSQGVDRLQGVSFLKNIAQDKLQSSEKKLLDMLQEGTDNFPGIGQHTGKLEDIMANSKNVSKDISDAVKEYSMYKTKAKDLLAKETELIKKRNDVLKVLGVGGLLSGGGAGVAYGLRKLGGQ